MGSELFYQNMVDEKIDCLNKEFHIDLFEIRHKVLHGKSVYVRKIMFEEIQAELACMLVKYVAHLLKGLRFVMCDENTEVYLIVYDKNYQLES